MPDQLGVNYHGRVFRPAGDPANAARGRYFQDGDLVWAEFSGGDLRTGRLVGRCAPDGTIDGGYCQVHADGAVVAGRLRSTPEVLVDGRIMLTENWQRADGSSGQSRIEEVRS